MSFNQLKLEVHDTYWKDEKLTKIYEAVADEDVINKSFSDEKLLKINGHLSFKDKGYNEF